MKENMLKWLHTLRFQLNDILEKTKLAKHGEARL
jgi:hypothetical protein